MADLKQAADTSSAKAAALWSEITQQPRPNRRFDFPRNKPDGTPVGQLAMVILTQGDNMAAAAAAERTARKLSGAGANTGELSSELYKLATACELLSRACKDPEDPDLRRPFFPNVTEIQRYLTVDEIGVLMNQYMVFRRETSPIVGEMEGEEEIEAWIATLAEGGNFDPLASASLGLLRQCVIVLANRLYGSPQDNSSPGSQHDSGESLSESSPLPESEQSNSESRFFEAI